MAFRMSDKEWEDIKKKSTGSYTTTEEDDKARAEEESKLADELDDEKMRKEQAKYERERKKSEREDKKFAKEHPESDFAKQYNKAHPKATKKQSSARSKVDRTLPGSPETSIPGYRSPNFNISKSGYTPLNYKPISGSSYKPVSDSPYYKPTNISPMGSGEYFKAKPYKPIFGGKVPMPKASKSKKSSKGRISPITGFLTF